MEFPRISAEVRGAVDIFFACALAVIFLLLVFFALLADAGGQGLTFAVLGLALLMLNGSAFLFSGYADNLSAPRKWGWEVRGRAGEFRMWVVPVLLAILVVCTVVIAPPRYPERIFLLAGVVGACVLYGSPYRGATAIGRWCAVGLLPGVLGMLAVLISYERPPAEAVVPLSIIGVVVLYTSLRSFFARKG